MRTLAPTPTRSSVRRRSALGVALVGLWVGFGAGGCGSEADPIVPPPVAGLQHVESAAVGSAVRFSAANTAVTYAVQLRVVDDLDRSSVVHSTISVASAIGVACGTGDLSLCDSGRCAAGACVALACAGPEACPADLVCSEERCVLPERASEDGARRYGADGARTGLDAAP